MEIKRKGITLTVDVDEFYFPNPREEDEHLGTMVCFHGRYNLGDEHEFHNPSEFNEWCKQNEKDIYCKLPLYLLDHSGLAMSVFDYNDPWDSGQVGYIYCTHDDIKRIGLDEKNRQAITQSLIDEVKEYSEYLSGYPPYYYFAISNEDDEMVDSCTGFRGEKLKDVIENMLEHADEKYHFLFNHLLKQEENCLWIWIYQLEKMA